MEEKKKEKKEAKKEVKKEEKKEVKKKEKKFDIISITKTAVIVALVFLLGMTPLGYIPFGSLQITTVHVLVIIITILFGLKEGLIAGLTFGVTSIITSLMGGAGLFTPIFLNPLVSIFPRLLLPIVAYYLFHFFYRLLSWRMQNRASLAASSVISAIVSTIVHSVSVIALIWAFHWMSANLTDQVLLPIIISLLTVNMPLEILFAAVIAGIMVPILYPWFDSDDYQNHDNAKQ